MKRLDFVENNSDNYPVGCTLQPNLNKAQKKDSKAVNSIKVNWKKTDLEAYRLNLTELLSNFEVTAASASDLDNSVIKFNNILQRVASVAGPSTVRRMRKPKLVNWSPQIRLIVKEKKSALAEWEKGGCPVDPNHPLLIAKRVSRLALRHACRNQTAVKH